MAKSPEEIEAGMIASLKETTGKTLDEWHSVVAASGLAKHGELVSLLKSKHGIGHGYANLIVHRFNKSSASAAAGDGEDLVAA